MIGLGELVEAASKAFSSIGQMPEGVSRRIWQEINPFFATLGRAMTERWMPHLVKQIPCALRQQGAPPCPHLSVGLCMACGMPVCPYHSCVDHTGGAICFACVQIAMQGRKHAPPPPPGKTREAAKKEEIDQAYRTLGVKPGTSFVRVKTAYRSLVKLHHVDKGGDLEVIKRINAAFTLLKLEHESQRKVA